MSMTLYTRDERRYTEQIRFLIQETGLRVREKTVSAEEQAAMVKEGKLMFNKLPLLTIGDFALNESAAILEHLANLADKSQLGRGKNYLGANEQERTYARSLVYAANEFRRQLYEQYLVDSDRQDKAKFTSETLPEWLDCLNKLAVETESDDLGLGPGTDFTFGDISFFEAIDQIVTHFGKDLLEKYREARDYYNKCASRARFRMHLDHRPQRAI